jgi:hypothetical protein
LLDERKARAATGAFSRLTPGKSRSYTVLQTDTAEPRGGWARESSTRWGANEMTVITSTGKVLAVGDGDGDGVVIVDAWSGQPLMTVDDLGDDQVINVRVTPEPGVRIVESTHTVGEYEVFADRLDNYPVTDEARWKLDEGTVQRTFLPRTGDKP